MYECINGQMYKCMKVWIYKFIGCVNCMRILIVWMIQKWNCLKV